MLRFGRLSSPLWPRHIRGWQTVALTLLFLVTASLQQSLDAYARNLSHRQPAHITPTPKRLIIGVISTDPSTTTYSHDELDRLTTATYGPSDSVSYTYDEHRNRLSQTSGLQTTTYTYDELDRVDFARCTDGGTATFGYDANGNRTTVSASGITTTYGYNTLGQLTSITDNAGTPLDLSLTCDLNGNRISVTGDTTSTVTRQYSYDGDNRLTQATVNSTTTDYSYLGDDTRQSTTVGATTTDYVYDRTSGLAQVVDDGTNAYLHGVTGNLVGIDGTDEPTYPLQDGLGSVRLTVDDSGTILGTREWDAWGNIRTSTGTGYGFGWAGEQYDSSSDLTYLRSRYYSSGTAQFLSRDSIQPNSGGTTGYNPYSYANGNPVTYTDPSGHFVSYEEFGGGPFAYLAYVFSCYLGGTCLYQGEHGEDTHELVGGAQRAAHVRTLLATNASVISLGKFWPETPRFPDPRDWVDDLDDPSWDDLIGDDGWFVGICDKYVTGLGCDFPEDCAVDMGSLQDRAQASLRDLMMGLMTLALPEFKCLKNRFAFHSFGLNWNDDNCSHAPDNPLGVPFETSCHRHDFAYRNYPTVLRLDLGRNLREGEFRGSDDRDFADTTLRNDLKWTCDNRLSWLGDKLTGCYILADSYYLGVTEGQDRLMP